MMLLRQHNSYKVIVFRKCHKHRYIISLVC